MTTAHPNPLPEPVELDIEIRHDTADPIYVQLADQIRAAIRDGRLKPGDRLPTTNAYGMAQFTARKALRILAAEGLVRTNFGRGTYVIEPPASSEVAAAREAE